MQTTRMQRAEEAVCAPGGGSPKRVSRLLVGGLLLGALLAGGCGEREAERGGGAEGAGDPSRGASASGEAPASASTGPELEARGQQVYRNACSACHAFDPAEEGAVGPAIAGASLELLRAKVLRNEYPPDYEPKRDTRVMVPLPHVEEDLPALAAYLRREAGG